MVLKLKAGSGNQPLPDGNYEASLTKVEETSNADGPYLKWIFCLDSHGQMQNITGFTPLSLDQDTKTRFWVEALLGRQLKDDEEVDLERLYGRVCQLTLTAATLDSGRQVNRIARIEKRTRLSLKARQKTVPEPTSPDEGEDDLPF